MACKVGVEGDVDMIDTEGYDPIYFCVGTSTINYNRYRVELDGYRARPAQVMDPNHLLSKITSKQFPTLNDE